MMQNVELHGAILPVPVEALYEPSEPSDIGAGQGSGKSSGISQADGWGPCLREMTQGPRGDGLVARNYRRLV